MEDFSRLSEKYGIPPADVVMIALNAHGVRSVSGLGRARCLVAPEMAAGRIFRTIIATGRPESPFEVDGDRLLLDGVTAARVTRIEHDDARLGYFRDQQRVLTLNTHSRSSCTGCVFCPNTGNDASDPRVNTATDELSNWLAVLCQREGIADLSGVEQANLSTSCFGNEGAAIEHLKFLRGALARMGFKGRLGILSSVIRTQEGFRELAETVGPFALFLTLECVTRRALWLKESKANLTPAAAVEVLATARDAGCSTGVTLVVGLDPLADLGAWLSEALPHVSDFPNLQIYQAHSSYMQAAGVMGDDPLEWFLGARCTLEDWLYRYKDRLRPEHWQNYRPFWYTQYLGEELCTPGTVMLSP